jgi:seryl-tRNA synthetase
MVICYFGHFFYRFRQKEAAKRVKTDRLEMERMKQELQAERQAFQREQKQIQQMQEAEIQRQKQQFERLQRESMEKQREEMQKMLEDGLRRQKQELEASLLRTKPVEFTVPTKPVRGGLKIQTAESSSDSFGPKKGSSFKIFADAENSSNSR